MSAYKCRSCHKNLDKCTCDTATYDMRTKHHDAVGEYVSDAEILTWYKSQRDTSPGKDTSVNNGGSTDYYKFDPLWKECGDIIEAREMNYNQGNIFKAAFCFNTGRHSGTTYERELNKIIYFAKRELLNLKS